jgi:hypothetical protein
MISISHAESVRLLWLILLSAKHAKIVTVRYVLMIGLQKMDPVLFAKEILKKFNFIDIWKVN